MTGPNASLIAPIFVVGHPRSGTSLLAAMLGRHPDLLALPETHFFNEVRYAIAPRLGEGPDAVARRIATTRMRHLPLDKDAVKVALSAAEMTPKAVFEALSGALLADAGRGRLVEKTPVHIRHIGDILATWPDAHVVWIVRDGRAAVSSLRKLDWASKDLSLLARQWVRNMRFGLAAVAAEPGRVTRIGYEDLVADPEDALRRLCGGIGLGYDPAMQDHARPTASVSAFEESWKANVSAPMMAGRAEAWRRELAPAEIAAVEAIMAPVLTALGYPVDRPASFAGLLERVRQTLVNGAPGRRAQMLLYDLFAARRYAPDGASQANAKRG